VIARFRNSLLLAVWSLALFGASVLIDTRHHDFPYFYHPDEPGKVGQIISGKWNLHHPMLLLQTTKLFVEMTGVPRAEQPVVEAGRVVSAIFCSGAVVALSLLAYAWRGWGAALAAGGVLAWHHQLFELAHYLKEDSAVLFGMSVAFLAAWLFAQRGTWPRAAFLGAGCALAISGKYLGAVTLLVALPLLWRSREHRARSFGIFFLFLFLFLLVVNFAIFAHLRTFTHSFARETSLVVHGQAGMTRNVPHTQYWNIFLDNNTPVVWVLLLVFLIARWRQRRTLTFIEIALSAFPFLFALALSFSPKSNDRYFLPATALFSVLAVIGASDLADWLAPRWPRRTVFAIAALALVAAQFPSWTGSRPGWIGYNLAFQHDDTAELIEWLKTNVPPAAVIAKDNRVALPDPRKKRDASRMGIIPQKVLTHKSGFAADLGTLDELQARGVTHVAVSEMDYGKFFLRGLRPQKSGDGDFERRRAFYDQLIDEGELLWEREKSTVLYLHPGIRVYRLR
jgi:hypothetical protein